MITAFKFSLSGTVLFKRLIISGMLISKKINNCFVEQHCFSNYKTVDLVNVYQIVYVKKKFLKTGMFSSIFIWQFILQEYLYRR